MNPKITKVCSPFQYDRSIFLNKNVVLANSDEKIIDYDPNDPNLVDEPYLDVENHYEGLGPGRPDSFTRTLMPTAGRQSPDSFGQGKFKRSCFPLAMFVDVDL